MKIKSVEFRNFASYGSNDQVISLDGEAGFYLVVGENGHGKCVEFETEIEIEITDPKILKKWREFSVSVEYIRKQFNGYGKEKESDANSILDRQGTD